MLLFFFKSIWFKLSCVVKYVPSHEGTKGRKDFPLSFEILYFIGSDYDYFFFNCLRFLISLIHLYMLS